MRILDWALRIIVAVILLQTLFFKFTGTEEARQLFQTLGVEPWGRYATGVMELIAGTCILAPRTVWLGALLGVGLMIGAIFSHLTKLGIEVNGDGGMLFIMALVVLAASGATLYLHRKKIPLWKLKLARRVAGV